MIILSVPISGDDNDERPWVSMLIDGDEIDALVNGEPAPMDKSKIRPSSPDGISLDEISAEKK
jgi:hypothetical protein